MSLVERLIIPLLDKRITLENVSHKSHFVGVGCNNPNRPYLDNHIFLLYRYNLHTPESFYRALKFDELSSISDKEYVTLEGKTYVIYTFPVVSPIVRNIMKNCSAILNPTARKRILSFWGNTNDELIRFVCDGKTKVQLNFTKIPIQSLTHRDREELERVWSGEQSPGHTLFLFNLSNNLYKSCRLKVCFINFL